MTKLAIVTQPDQGVLLDVGGCHNLDEVNQHLTSTLKSSIWENQDVDINLGELNLSSDDVSQMLGLLSNVGVKPRQVFAEKSATKEALSAHNLTPAQVEAAKADADAVNTPASLASTPAGEESSKAEDADKDAVAKTADTDGAGAAQPEGKEKSDSDATAGDTAGATTEPKRPAAPQPPAVLYLRQTLRSGQTVNHNGDLVIIGDVNNGAEVISHGDITVWGALRGMAHAGAGGNINAEIRALKFQPLQLRIAHAIARSPDRTTPGYLTTQGPETARVVSGKIRITSSAPD